MGKRRWQPGAYRGHEAANLTSVCGRNQDPVGGEFAIVPELVSETDLGSATARRIDRGWRGRVRVASGRKIDLAVVGDARGVWDGARLQQTLSNLVLNASIRVDPFAILRA